MKVLLVAGARPNFMKVAPLIEALRAAGGFTPFLVHTGQHYDEKLSRIFFEELGLPRPDVDLGVGSGRHAAQTAAIMERFEPVLLEEKPDLLIVVGDVNSTVACALTAVKEGVPVAHVEAGLRSFDEKMPEEINRRLTDHMAELLFVSEPSGVTNLRNESIPEERIHLVGNVMIDTLLRHRERARGREAARRLGVKRGEFVLVTLHRPSNVDDPEVFGGILEALAHIGETMPVLFPVHPRTAAALRESGQYERAAEIGGMRLLEPLGYLDFLDLMNDAKAVLTDSGGIQEETTVLGVPCLTIRENTERPITIEQGTNRLVGPDRARIVAAFELVHGGAPKRGRVPELWDGGAAERIVRILEAGMLGERGCEG